VPAADLIRHLELEPHPEGGWYRRVFEHPDAVDGRPIASAIYYLLEAGDRSHWHRLDAVELWHHYAGAPLELSLSVDERTVTTTTLGPDVLADEVPMYIAPAGTWMSAESTGEFTLVGCTVSPAFAFDGFELAPPDWSPGAPPGSSPG
jgi:uncharacterized protein